MSLAWLMSGQHRVKIIDPCGRVVYQQCSSNIKYWPCSYCFNPCVHVQSSIQIAHHHRDFKFPSNWNPGPGCEIWKTESGFCTALILNPISTIQDFTYVFRTPLPNTSMVYLQRRCGRRIIIDQRQRQRSTYRLYRYRYRSSINWRRLTLAQSTQSEIGRAIEMLTPLAWSWWKSLSIVVWAAFVPGAIIDKPCRSKIWKKTWPNDSILWGSQGLVRSLHLLKGPTFFRARVKNHSRFVLP